MVIFKAKEISRMSENEINSKIKELKLELIKKADELKIKLLNVKHGGVKKWI